MATQKKKNLTAIEGPPQKCEYEEDGSQCGRPYFGPGKITGKKCCSAHYQRERRILLNDPDGVLTPDEIRAKLNPGAVREYGEGSFQVSTRVTADVEGYMDALARRKYPKPDGTGDVSKVLREILELFMEGNQLAPGEEIDAPEEVAPREFKVDTNPNAVGANTSTRTEGTAEQQPPIIG